MTPKQLERKALDAYRRGIGWNDYWNTYGVHVRSAVAMDRVHGFYRKLLSIVVSGDAANIEELSGTEPEPWLHDDAQVDTTTVARWLGHHLEGFEPGGGHPAGV